MAGKQTHNFFLYNFLINRQYRIGRHILLISAVALIALNQAYSMGDGYYLEQGGKLELGNKLFVIMVAVILSYLAAIYYNLYILVPKYLFTKRYFRYSSGVVLSAVGLVILLDIVEYGTYIAHGLSIGCVDIISSLLSDFIFSFPLLIICIIGGTATALLRQWGVENENIMQLKNNYLQSEIEQLKERVSPDFLFHVLNKAGDDSIDKPEEASQILLKLSRILRYQLYDCTRETVLLNSEITFIQNYLDLYQAYNCDFKYSIDVKGDLKHKFVPPLLFLPLIQLVINKAGDKSVLNIRLTLTDRFIEFICGVPETAYGCMPNACDMRNVERRLKYLYKDSYSLRVNNEQVILWLKD